MSEPERSEASEVSVAQRARGSAESGGAEAAVAVTHRRPHTACSMCKQAIPPDRPRFRCSVSACNAGRVKLRFCSPACFERHIPTARHRKADCVEE